LLRGAGQQNQLFGDGGWCMSDDEFDAFIADANQAFERKQADLTRRFGLGSHARWDYDQLTELLRFSDASGQVLVEASAIAIGSFSGMSKTWKWAWSNQSVPEPARSRSARLRGLFETTGMEVFRKGSFAADEEMAWELAAMCVAHLSAQGCYRGPAGHLHVFLAIESIRSLDSATRITGSESYSDI
jgi:hypothetical protein